MVKIGKTEVAFGMPTYVIAEAGINHVGRFDVAKQLVNVAVRSRCNAIKFQTFKESEVKFPNLTYDEFAKLKAYCDSKNITFLSTPHSLSAIDFLAPIVPAFKIASSHMTCDYFVKRVKMKGKPILVSTGNVNHSSKMANKDEITNFLRIVSTNLVLLFCVSEYPCYNFDVKDFENFMVRYEPHPIGISCHYPDIEFSLQAVQVGACVVEKHITIDDDFDCPDKAVSLNPEKLTQLVREIRILDKRNR